MTETQNNYFPALTGIRAVAAFLVFAFHYNPFDPNGLLGFINEWHIGVSIFFVLSGFLISFRYYSTPNASLKTYFLNRFARIYPVYFLLTIITFALSEKEYGSDAFTILAANLLLIKGLFYDLTFTVINQTWSLTVEEFFYLLAPIFFWFARKSIGWLILLPLILIFLGLLLVYAFREVHFYGFFGNLNFMFLYTFFGRSVEFFVGIFLGIQFRKWKFESRRPVYTTLGVGIIALVTLALSYLKGEAKYGVFTPQGIFLNNFILPIFGVSLLFTGLVFEDSKLKKILSSKTMILLGKSSYVFYLIHMGIIADFLGNDLGMNSLFKFIALNIIAVLIFKWVEEPLNRLTKKLFA